MTSQPRTLAQAVAALRPLDPGAVAAARQRQARLTKPPGALGVGAVALAAHVLNRACGNPLDRLALVLATAALLGAYGVLVVIERDDRDLAWSRMKGWLSMRKTV